MSKIEFEIDFRSPENLKHLLDDIRIIYFFFLSCEKKYIGSFFFSVQETLRREVGKQQAGNFSFIVVVFVALLGILLGYFFKK